MTSGTTTSQQILIRRRYYDIQRKTYYDMEGEGTKIARRMYYEMRGECRGPTIICNGVNIRIVSGMR